MMPSDQITIREFRGSEVKQMVKDVARFRIEGFRAYPYLYEGTMAYEESYLSHYAEEEHALLVCAYRGKELCAVATSLPLLSGSSIVGDAPELFRAHGFDPAAYYYFAEIIVTPNARGLGIAKTIYDARKRHAQSLALNGLCLAVVQRPDDHPLKPSTYLPPERIWVREGFLKTNMKFSYEWPTIQPDGSVRSQQNEMRFWIKQAD